MIPGENKDAFKGARSMFLAGNLTRMRDIKDLYPTNIAKALGMNHGRYIDKLYHPEKFTIGHIWCLSKLLRIDVQLILDVIKSEIINHSKIGLRKEL